MTWSLKGQVEYNTSINIIDVFTVERESLIWVDFQSRTIPPTTLEGKSENQMFMNSISWIPFDLCNSIKQYCLKIFEVSERTSQINGVLLLTDLN